LNMLHSYGGTALRVLYGLDRFSGDLDFPLLETNPNFELAKYLAALEKELNRFGFEAPVEKRNKKSLHRYNLLFLKPIRLTPY